MVVRENLTGEERTSWVLQGGEFIRHSGQKEQHIQRCGPVKLCFVLGPESPLKWVVGCWVWTEGSGLGKGGWSRHQEAEGLW